MRQIINEKTVEMILETMKSVTRGKVLVDGSDVDFSLIEMMFRGATQAAEMIHDIDWMLSITNIPRTHGDYQRMIAIKSEQLRKLRAESLRLEACGMGEYLPEVITDILEVNIMN